MKERLDVLLVKRNLAESREKAKAIIMSGNVFVEGQREDKAGSTFSDEVQIEIKGHTLPYVSRGGLKLEKAMNNFELNLKDKVCTDVGSSTGGFTDCMLQNGARKVFAIVALIKPQFEAGREKVGKKGVVREKSTHHEVIEQVISYAVSIGFQVLELEYSPIKGPEGNIEYLVHLKKTEEPVDIMDVKVDYKHVVDAAFEELAK